MRRPGYLILFIFILQMEGHVLSQDATLPYPIIFVHGLNSFEGTWDSTLNTIFSNFGEKQIFHAVLNAYSGNKSIDGSDGEFGTNDDDVLFPNLDQNGIAINQLHNGNIFVINFQNFWNENPDDPRILTYNSGTPNNLSTESKSNESAIYKQGFALSECIKAVRNATKADKVILVGHSMGGLAIREYLQRIENGKRKWWVDPSDSFLGHHVAKVVTIGTPHLGCNLGCILEDFSELLTLVTADLKSEAARDLRYNYHNTSTAPNNIKDDGVYLFGGSEVQTNIGDYHNKNFNCDSTENSFQIIGLNSPNIPGNYNILQPLPSNISYVWIVSNFRGLGNDLVVRGDRQYLYNIGDTLITDKFHLDEPSDYYSIIRGLDEPGDSARSYKIDKNGSITGFITFQKDNFNLDVDLYKINLDKSGKLTIKIDGQIFSGIGQVALLDSSLNPLSFKSTTQLPTTLEYDVLAGTYFIKVRGLATKDSYKYPYNLISAFKETLDTSDKRIILLEYFIDTDPGLGKGFALEVASPGDVNGLFNIPLNNISNGFHSLYLRAKDNFGRWSITQISPFFKNNTKSSDLRQIAFYIDSVSGNEPVLTTTNIEENFKSQNIPLTNISKGFHTLYSKIIDIDGHWSFSNLNPFYVSEMSNSRINRMEYFIDTDPGFGIGTPLIVSNDSILCNNFSLNLESLSEGFHSFFIRAKNSTGMWSLTTSCIFYKSNFYQSKISELSYFFDSDHEIKNEVVIKLSQMAYDFSDSFNISLSCLTTGKHVLYLKVYDDSKKSSMLYSKYFSMNSLSPIISENEGVLNSNVATGNQWYNDEGLIVNATKQDLVATSSGNYYVIVTNSGCMSERSNIIQVVLTNNTKTNNQHSIRIFPNPSKDFITITGLIKDANLIITDLSGKTLFSKHVRNNETVIISMISRGLYLVKLMSVDSIYETKILKY